MPAVRQAYVFVLPWDHIFSLYLPVSLNFSPDRKWRGFRQSGGPQGGLTLIEMVVTLSLFSILLAMGIGALSYYSAAKSLDTAAREIATQMREAQAMAVATGNTYRIDFSDNTRRTYQLQRRQGDSYEAVRNPVSLPSGVEFDASSLPSFGSDSYLDFYARGSAESGQLVLKGGYGRTKVIYVDGVTANVRIE